MVKVSICCRNRDATKLLAPLFVTKRDVIAALEPERQKEPKEDTCDYLYNYDQENGEVEGEEWDVVDDESRGADGMNC